MKKSIIELVTFTIADGIEPGAAQSELKKLNSFLAEQPGFVSRKTAVAANGQYIDLVYWTDMHAAQTASEKAMHDPETNKVFAIIDPASMTMKHFEIFNDTE